MCKTHAVEQADRLFSLLVREVGHCEAVGPHSGNLQCAHGFSRRYKNVRYNRLNAFCLCAGHHTFYTHRPLEWDDWFLERVGYEVYWDLRMQALSTTKPDLEAVLNELKAAV
jgi:hypothetical protein